MKTGTGPKHGKESFKPKTVSVSHTHFNSLKLKKSATSKRHSSDNMYGVGYGKSGHKY